ncbi:GIY-YIG nuclease family protein [Parvularcula sp. BGMRC 0090]|uniref:GIY-YIG nuclease family protein n=2 Tax=Parvularcula maris TaxID=2965077 RepID=A0A9X2LB02_9PROT|nr:GIY-YIG nuclease family protein [Parvularcula maris]
MARFDFIATYMLANRRNGAIYTGSSSDLPARMGQHKMSAGARFPAKYGCMKLVWYERHETIGAAVHREKRLKTWPRRWKVELIEARNGHWSDLSAELMLG